VFNYHESIYKYYKEESIFFFSHPLLGVDLIVWIYVYNTTITRNLFFLESIGYIYIFFNNIDLTGICQAKKKKFKPQQWTFPLPVATGLM